MRNGLTFDKQLEYLNEIKAFADAMIESNTMLPRAPCTGKNVPVSDSYILITLLIELGRVTVSPASSSYLEPH
jgi:hypothetical protein